MPNETKTSDRVSDFLFTTLWLSFLNYCEVFSNMTDPAQRIKKSILVAGCSGLLLSLARPVINTWLKPLIKRSRGTDAGIIMQLITYAVFFGVFIFINLLHHRGEPGWDISKALMLSASVGILIAMFFMALLWVIKKIRGSKRETDREE